MTPERLSGLVKDRARSLGFDSAGITDLAPTAHGEVLTRWLEQGMGGNMRYLDRQAARRREPGLILPGATRVVVVTRNYFQPDPPRTAGTGLVAKYARGPDYHETLRPPLESLASYLVELGGPGTMARHFVDAGPLPERELAQRAGLGWIGKNTMLIDPDRGSFFFIGSILTNLELDLDPPFQLDRCGTCRRCLDACPTHAFPEARVLDARRCISYLTIEYHGPIADDLARQMGDWIFGCDICQDVCPWNEKFATAAEHNGQSADLARLDLATLESLGDEEFDIRFGETALERTRAQGLRRNAAIALRNQELAAPCPTR